MSQPSLRRHLTVGVLAAALTVAGAAPANARDPGTAGHAWLWLQDVWSQGVSVLWSKAVPSWAKQGLGVDPSGKTPPPPRSANPPSGTGPDQGLGLDPDG